MEVICDSTQCTGCFTCQNACPVSAITMQEKGIGHLYPVINHDKCIDCGKCVRVCPVNSKPELYMPKKTYAAWASDLDEHKTSTSGGVAAVLTRKILEDGGVVYGCALKDGEIKHIRVNSLEDAQLLKGSKYVHSHINDAIKDIQTDIKIGRKVLFVGTPCQVAGIKSYFSEKSISNNFFTADLICHGVPPQRILFEYLSCLGFIASELTQLKFREQGGCYLYVAQSNKCYRASERKDLYYMAFNDNILFRESCFSCRYAILKRVGDLTIGDFWGLGKTTPFQYKTGGNISVVLVNTPQGQSLLAECSESGSLILFERSLEEAVNGNHNLKHPSPKNNADRFRKLYPKYPLKIALNLCLVIRRIRSILSPVKMFLQKMAR